MGDSINPCEAVRELLIADPTILGLVSDRIRPGVLDQNDAMPIIRYDLVSTSRRRNLDGSVEQIESRIQIDHYAATWQEAYALAAATIAVLDGYRGYAAGLFFHDVAIENEYDQTDAPFFGSNDWRRRRTIDAVVVHSMFLT